MGIWRWRQIRTWRQQVRAVGDIFEDSFILFYFLDYTCMASSMSGKDKLNSVL